LKLYWSPRSPFALKALICAHAAGYGDRVQTIVGDSAMHAPSVELLALNPLSKIPTLVPDDGGEPVFDSAVIGEYLAALNPASGLVPDGPARLEALRWQAVGDGLMDVLVLWRNERDRPDGRSLASWQESFRRRTVSALDWLEARADPLTGRFDLGRISIGCALSYLDLRFEALNWREGRPSLAAWHGRFRAHPPAAAGLAVYGGAPSEPAPEPPPRVEAPRREDMTPRQAEVFDAIAGGPRGGVRGPFLALLHSPELADRWQKLGAFLRYESVLDAGVRETAILATAQRWACETEWRLHVAHARDAGLGEPMIASLRAGSRPPEATTAQAAAWDFVTELHDRHAVSDPAFAAAREAFGTGGVVELTAVAGYYAMIAMMLNGHRITPPPAP
jgi:glutathione S-transferase